MRLNIPDISGTSSANADFDIHEVQVPPSRNPQSARIAIVGGACTWQEVKEKEPFTGPLGSQLSRITSAIMLPRHEIYMTHCLKQKYPYSKKEKLWTHKGWRHPAWGELQKNIIDELSTISAKIIVLASETAMRMILDSPEIDSISKYRGSCYHAEDFPHLAEKLAGKILCITESPATTHPSVNPLNFYIIMNDLSKFMDLIIEPELMDVEVIIHTNPTLNAILEFYARIMTDETEIAIDIEATPRYITCFSLTIGTNEVMSVPLINNKGNMWSPYEEVQIWQGFAMILEDPAIAKIAQNGMFDFMFILRTMGIKTENFSFDTMIAQHLTWTDLRKGLDFLTSIYTYFPYYKDEGKQTHFKLIKDWPKYWQYNAKDALYTRIIKDKLAEQITSMDAWEHFNESMSYHPPLMEMQFKGMLTNRSGIISYRQELEAEQRILQDKLDLLVGHSLNQASPKQMCAYFYGEKQIPPYMNYNKKTKKSSQSCDAVALSRIARKKVSGSKEAQVIMKMRKNAKLIGTYFTVPIDSDNKLRCSYNICGTSSGRLSSEATFFGTGTNLQNQPPKFKEYIIADPNHIMFEWDLAKAEAHIVAFLAQDANMIHAFESGVDVHSYNASKIFNIPIEEVTKAQRSLGKRVVHASNYGMGPMVFSNDLAKDDIFMSMGECQRLLDAYARRFPMLKTWHEEIRYTVASTKMLHNLFGKPKRFLKALNNHELKSAYSYIPQSTVGELVNKINTSIYNDPELDHVDMLATVHDSGVNQLEILSNGNLNNVYTVLNLIKKHSEYEFTHKGRSFIIGIDAKIGFSWGKDYIELPDFELKTIEDALTKLEVAI